MLESKDAAFIWDPVAHNAYIQFTEGEIHPVESDAVALWLQARVDRTAGINEKKFHTVAAALRSVAEEHGRRATVHARAWADWDGAGGPTFYLGCEGGRRLYRVRGDAVDLIPNGEDGVLILDGTVPVLDDLTPTGELTRWLAADTWATPVGRLTLALLAPLVALGAQSFDFRPLLIAVGLQGSGKTSTTCDFGLAIAGGTVPCQAPTSETRNDETLLFNHGFVVFDNVEAAPKGSNFDDFLATAVSQRERTIRRMRSNGESMTRPIHAFVATTSFTTPGFLKRSDLLARGLVVEFTRPEKGAESKFRDPRLRRLNRRALWADLLCLLQRIAHGWGDTPTAGDFRLTEFVRVTHTLLGVDAAEALTQHQAVLRSEVAGEDDPLLEALEANPPPRERMTAVELNAHWPLLTSTYATDQTRNRSMGNWLKRREGRLGRWQITIHKDDAGWKANTYSFTLVEKITTLTNDDATDLLQKLITGTIEN